MSKSRFDGDGSPSLRLLRVGENVRHAISSILARGDVQDPDLETASVTVSEVRISPDLRNATVFVMPLGGDEDGKVTKALNKNSAFIRGQMSKVVHMKYMPRLKFKLDESFDEASHIDAILRDPRVQQDIKTLADVSDDEE
ncbi:MULTISPECIES: 30S ribosome-binding factor RbfA [Kordiimonas]|uniref:30S ribosome-binding factor RbfA n=1 Tax=Kordiimonas TaxID=288021 RepID=UPI001FF40843|nr:MULTISPECIES: 30S ribosome-binding factor RbfA [Kordiimonas]MCK0069302.1 30S ribosome-binding factor RbfA [Kordiimonas laminariae]UTW58631.1 30S ribosome-binding factor RbfA [Kordiimonas sp. SCSIO 12603]